MLAPLALETAPVDQSPASGVRVDAGMANALEDVGTLVRAADWAGVEPSRLLRAVAVVVLAAVAGADLDRRTRNLQQDAAEAVIELLDSKAAGKTCDVVARWATVVWTDPSGRAVQALCQAAARGEFALLLGDYTADADDDLVQAVGHAAEVLGSRAVAAAFSKVIPWGELAESAARVEL